MRGALARPIFAVQRDGIIPADAGSTWLSYLFCNISQDHPRGCGEHQVPLPVLVVFTGSSPRMRGAQIDEANAEQQIRIIPADAGSTADRADRWYHPEDHPRGCGEHAVSV